MNNNRKLVKALAWLQLSFSVLLGATAIWGYGGYRSALGPFTQSLAIATVSTADVISRTAETVQAKQSLLDNTLEMLVSMRKLIEELRSSAQAQTELAPKYAEGLRGAAGLLGTSGGIFSKLGDSLMFSMPTGIEMQGIRPMLVMTKPLEATAKSFKENSEHLKSLGEGLVGVSSSLAKDGHNISSAFVDTSNNAIKLLDDTEKTLAVLKGLEFPKALANLKVASDNLRAVGAQADIAGNFGLILLITGLLLSGWCFLNSLSLLIMTKECPTETIRIIQTTTGGNE